MPYFSFKTGGGGGGGGKGKSKGKEELRVARETAKAIQQLDAAHAGMRAPKAPSDLKTKPKSRK